MQIAKFGKRPIYVASFALYTVFTFGAGACKTWSSQLALRILVSFFLPLPVAVYTRHHTDRPCNRLALLRVLVNYLAPLPLPISGLYMSVEQH